MKKQYKIQLPKGKKVTMTNVDFEDGVMTVNVELENREEQKYEPKDGDFVFFNYGTEPTIAIYKRIYWGSAIITYASCCNMLPTTYEKTIVYWANDIRPATEREKKILIDQLAKVNKKWNPNTKQIEDVRWRAVYEMGYFYIDNYFNVIRARELNERVDELRNKLSNYFKTYEAAEKVAEQIRDIFKNSKSE